MESTIIERGEFIKAMLTALGVPKHQANDFVEKFIQSLEKDFATTRENIRFDGRSKYYRV